ncbi:hypothetical protein [Roseovarius sp. E0-M6]|uniref:hypothetical protein n=1 Tax=Roseovarius sp. E0-M6 TaxID=3127118 RepID=UPI00301019EB
MKLLPIDPARAVIIKEFGGEITAIDPIGAQVSGIDLSSKGLCHVVFPKTYQARRGFHAVISSA